MIRVVHIGAIIAVVIIGGVAIAQYTNDSIQKQKIAQEAFNKELNKVIADIQIYKRISTKIYEDSIKDEFNRKFLGLPPLKPTK